MPQASELEEFGLEVEHEHDAFLGAPHGSTPSRSRPVPLGIASSDSNNRTSSSYNNASRNYFRPAILKWATLIIFLVVAVFFNLGEENEETTEVDIMIPEDLEVKKFKVFQEGGLTPIDGARVGDTGMEGHDGDNLVVGGGGQKPMSDNFGNTGDQEEDNGVGINEGIPNQEEIVEEVTESLQEERSDNDSEPDDDDADEGIAAGGVENTDEVQSKSSPSDHQNGDRPENVPESIETSSGNENVRDGNSENEGGSIGESQSTKDGGRNDKIAHPAGESVPAAENEVSRVDSGDLSQNEGVPTKPNSEGNNLDTEGSANNGPLAETTNDESTQTDGGRSEQTSSSSTSTGESAVPQNENKQQPEGGNAANFGSFTLEKLHATRQAAMELISSLEQYYSKYGVEKAREMMLNGWLEPWDFDSQDTESTTKRDRANKLVDTMARALVTEDQNEFIIGSIGSSVAAGHDNCHYDSYESQMERTFSPVWEAAGMKLTCQNAGEGGGCGDDYKNQIFCIKQNVSPQVDIAHYSWTYFEAGGPAWIERESLIRWTQMLPKQPPVHVFNTGELQSASSDEFKLTEYYSKYGYNALYMQSGMYLGGHDYESEKKNGVDRFSWGHVGDGYHDVVRYGQNEENELRKDSLGVVMRNWHPGPLAFQFTADSFTYVYTRAILQALDLIQKDMVEGKDPRETWSASKRTIMVKKSLPEPKYCDPEYCVVDEAPGCINYEKPTFGQWGPRVEDPNDDLNPHKGELQNWEVWHEDHDMWHMVTREDQAVFQNRDDKEICMHLDACGGISATSPDNGMVVFRLPKLEVGLVVMCGCCGKEIAQEMFLENEHIEVQYNGAVLDRASWDLFPNKKCVRLLKRFPTEGSAAKTPTGHAYLSIKALEGLTKPVRISHLITL